MHCRLLFTPLTHKAASPITIKPLKICGDIVPRSDRSMVRIVASVLAGRSTAPA